MECMQTAYDAGCNFFDNAEAYAAGESEAIMGRVIQELGWRRHDLCAQLEVLLGHRPRPQHGQHAQSQVPDAGDRRFTRASRGRLRRPHLLPSRRSEHADRRDGVGDVRHRLVGQGALLGHQRVDGRRDPCRVGDRRTSSSAQAGDGTAAIQPARSQEGRGGVRPAVHRHRSRDDDLESRWRRAC